MELDEGYDVKPSELYGRKFGWSDRPPRFVFWLGLRVLVMPEGLELEVDELVEEVDEPGEDAGEASGPK